MRVRPLLVLSCGALTLAACVLKADGFSGGAGASPDAGAADGGAPAPALDAATGDAAPPASSDGGDAGATPVDVLVNGGFENGCSGWSGPEDNPGNVTLTPSTEPHAGAKSCRVCSNAASDTYVYQTVDLAVPSGQRIFGQVYARGAQANPPGSNIQLLVSYTRVSAGDEDSPTEDALPPPTQWLRMSMVEEIYDDAKSVTLVVVLDGNQNKCVLIDDASLYVFPN